MENKIIPVAEVTAISPGSVKILVHDLDAFQSAENMAKVGSYLRILDNDNIVMIAIISSFAVSSESTAGRSYMLEAAPLGIIKNGKFERGGVSLSIPPHEVSLANDDDIRAIFETCVPAQQKFCFAKLSSNHTISVPVNGDKFFNKHIAIVGSTGSGKSHSVAKLLQQAVSGKNGGWDGLNNSHIVIFDIHAEYQAAFPNARILNISNLILPYWMMNSAELQEFFLDTQGNDHNQRNVFKEAVISSKMRHSGSAERITFDSPVFFEIKDVLQEAMEKNEEMIPGARSEKAGPLNGKLSNFISRLENKIFDRRLDFLMGNAVKNISSEDVLRQLLGYGEQKSNVTILDLSGIPFDVLSITVSLVSRILFEYGYYYKRLCAAKKQSLNNDVPVLLVYEEAHKYVPDDNMTKYRASRESIERIAKEGRKYGVSLMLASQRPSEISETIFSQCNNILALRLTNPADQNYVKRLLPDTSGNLAENMSSLRAGECLLIGDAVILPSVVQIDRCECTPASADIPYWDLWRNEWQEVDFESIVKLWLEQ